MLVAMSIWAFNCYEIAHSLWKVVMVPGLMFTNRVLCASAQTLEYPEVCQQVHAHSSILTGMLIPSFPAAALQFSVTCCMLPLRKHLPQTAPEIGTKKPCWPTGLPGLTCKSAGEKNSVISQAYTAARTAFAATFFTQLRP